MKHNRKKRTLWSFAAVFTICIIIATAFGIYTSDYYHADTAAISAFPCSASVTKTPLSDDVIAYSPEKAEAGFIFYPGGKVEYIAYEPLMKACAEKNILCILIQMPFNLAIFDTNAADGIKEQFPEIEHWYIGGHSLGGAMAASHISKNVDDFEGLILLGSYSTADLSKTDLGVLSIYGSEDKILNQEKYKKYKTNLPGDLSESILDGGCHSYFGMYGEQAGDVIPTLKNEEQITWTANKIMEFIK